MLDGGGGVWGQETSYVADGGGAVTEGGSDVSCDANACDGGDCEELVVAVCGGHEGLEAFAAEDELWLCVGPKLAYGEGGVLVWKLCAFSQAEANEEGAVYAFHACEGGERKGVVVSGGGGVDVNEEEQEERERERERG